MNSYLDLRRLVGREEYERAFESSVQLLDRYPDFPPLYETVAELGLYTRKWDRSEEFLAGRIRLGIKVPLALYGYAISLASRDDHAGAIQCCLEAIDRGLTYSGVYKELAYAYEKAYGEEEALSMLVRLSRRFPRSAGYHYAVAVELWNLGDFRPVVARLKEAVELDVADSRYADALAVADLHLAYSRRKAALVESRRALASTRGDIPGSQFLVSSLLSEKIYAGDHRRRDTLLRESTTEASEYGFLRWLGWNLQRSADVEGLASRLIQSRRLSMTARGLAFKSNDIALAMVATQRISSAFLEAGILDSALHYARLRWSLSSPSKSPNDYVSGMGKIALILFHMGHFELANEYCIEALAEADAKSVDAVTVVEIETTFGMIQERLGNVQQAFRHHRLARHALENGSALPYCLAANSGNLGRLSLSQRRFAEARHYFSQQLKIAQKLNYPNEKAYALINLGDLCSAQGRTMQSKALYAEALKIGQVIGSCIVEYEALSRLAMVAEYVENRQESLRYFIDLERVGMLCILNGRVKFSEFAVALKEKAHTEFTEHEWERGLATLELARLVEVYPYLGGSFFTLNPRCPKLPVKGFQDANSRLVSALTALQKQIEGKTPSLSSRSAQLLAMTEVVDAEVGIAQIARSSILNPSSRCEITKDDEHIGKLQQYLRGQNSCAIQYLVRDEEVTALCVTGDSVTYRRLETTKDALEKQIRLVSSVLKEGGIKVPLLHPSMGAFDYRILHNLYRLLLQPFRMSFEKSGRLIILQDGLLRTLPLEALVTDTLANGKPGLFLVEQKEVSYCHSLGQLQSCYHPNPSVMSVLAVADPVVANVNQKEGGIPNITPLHRYSKSGLPGTRNEVDAIRDLFGHRARLLVGASATKAEIIRALPSSRLIHLATHGVSECGQGDFIGLALSPSGSGASDGVFWLYELRPIELGTELAVLSGCRTARGGESDFGWSPAFAFWASGARAVIGTLWDVQDETSLDFMNDFYAAIGSGLSASAALRQAKLAQIAKGKRDPLIWASHVIIGDPNALQGVVPGEGDQARYHSWVGLMIVSSSICSLFSIAVLVALSTARSANAAGKTE